jgi:hypothetical protein
MAAYKPSVQGRWRIDRLNVTGCGLNMFHCNATVPIQKTLIATSGDPNKMHRTYHRSGFIFHHLNHFTLS